MKTRTEIANEILFRLGDSREVIETIVVSVFSGATHEEINHFLTYSCGASAVYFYNGSEIYAERWWDNDENVDIICAVKL